MEKSNTGPVINAERFVHTVNSYIDIQQAHISRAIYRYVHLDVRVYMTFKGTINANTYTFNKFTSFILLSDVGLPNRSQNLHTVQ